jgi:hypothetical protein
MLFIGCLGCEDSVEESLPDNINDPSNNDDQANAVYVLPNLDEPAHLPGIAIYTADMAKDRSTEVNSEWVIRKSQNVSVTSEILRNGFNALHKISFNRIENSSDYLEFVMALHGKLVNRVPVPEMFLNALTGISFRAVSYNTPILLTVEAYNIDGGLIDSKNFEINEENMQSYTFSLTNQDLHYISFKIIGENQDLSIFGNGAIGIDDVYITNTTTTPFVPSTDDNEFLNWLKTASINYFLWNYRDLGGGKGVVLESSYDTDKVSLSGIGYAYANYILAEQENLITPFEAKARILSMLRWQEAQNWNNGSEGVFGFPYHYFDANGNGLYGYSPEAVSTIDWAMCAAGIRTVKQRYSADAEIVNICNTLLNRPQWANTIHDNPNDSYKFGRITKGFSSSGNKNGQVWGDAFSEETELIYLEALASDQVDDLDLNRIFREQINGFYPSWFGSGFTYNWLQLWTGTINPYRTNSTLAYLSDASTSTSRFGKSYIGLTACGTISSIESNGFINWDRYIGNQGSSVSGANSNEVIQISPAPYGAALAIPFIPTEAIQSLRNYVSLGYYHPLLGFPDNIRMKDLPNGLKVPAPNWNPYDINIGCMAIAIDQYQQNSIAQYYTSDNNIVESLQILIESF